MDDLGRIIVGTIPELCLQDEDEQEDVEVIHELPLPEDEDAPPRKFYVDGETEEIAEEKIYDLDADNQLRLSQLIEHTRKEVGILYRSTLDIQERWIDRQG